jgi:hypothetical protein
MEINQQSEEQTKKCPKCAENVLKEAIVCKHCGAKFDLSSNMIKLGKNLMGFGCALTLLVFIILLLMVIL